MPYYKGFAAGLGLRFDLDMGKRVHTSLCACAGQCIREYHCIYKYHCMALYLCTALYLGRSLYLYLTLYLSEALYLCVLLSRILNKLSLLVLLL